MTRPNILFLMSDEHRYDVAGFAGNEVVRTPVLDRLAQSGIVFDNAYTPAPACVPARQCMMAGQLPKTCHCEGWIDLAPGYPTFAREFTRNGYHTLCSGKLHHLTQDQMQGWKHRVAPDAVMLDRYIEDPVESEMARYRTSISTGKWSNQREIEEARAVEGPYQVFDAQAVDAALFWLDRYFRDPVYKRPMAPRPLLLKLSLLQPHYPFFTDEDRFEYYLDRVPVFRQEPCGHPVLGVTNRDQAVDASEEALRRATAAYYGMTDHVDTYFGQVLDRIESLGQDLDDWIIVYTSDHGDMLGEHGIWEKTKFYEGSVRVPLIIRWPARFEGGRRVRENVNLCDLFATLCDMAGIGMPDNLDSRSLVPLMNGDVDNWDNESVSQFGRDHVMIKRGSLKYQYYGESTPEVLFDLEGDPGETENLAGALAYAEVMDRFRRRLAELGHGPDGDKEYVNAGYGAGSRGA